MVARPEGIACLAGIAPWKRKRVRAMLSAGRELPHARSARQAVDLALERGGAIACWASRQPAGLSELAAQAGVPVWLVEDGFIRSAGLGAALVQPCSLVLDSRGAHYDSTRPSDLEVLLENQDFAPGTLRRAGRLMERLKARRVTKYNLHEATRNDLPEGPFVLVLGQVDDDLSVLQGGAGQDVADMIAQVRAMEGSLPILFKPHPDVTSGLRQGVTAPQGCQTVPDTDLLWLIERARRVHVLTSLGGFEALLRGADVVCHGQPFYAGWGLTRDCNPLARRQQRLTLEELVAGALIDYPVYFDPVTGCRCEVEQLLDRIAEGGPAALPGPVARLRGQVALYLKGLARPVLNSANPGN